MPGHSRRYLGIAIEQAVVTGFFVVMLLVLIAAQEDPDIYFPDGIFDGWDLVFSYFPIVFLLTAGSIFSALNFHHRMAAAAKTNSISETWNFGLHFFLTAAFTAIASNMIVALLGAILGAWKGDGPGYGVLMVGMGFVPVTFLIFLNVLFALFRNRRTFVSARSGSA